MPEKVVAYKLTPLSQKDMEFMELQKLIKAKENLLLEKQKKLKNTVKENHFLEDVKNDYNKYYSYISKQKEDQIKALEYLSKYIKDLTVTGEISKQNINDANEEQRKILKEIKSIRKNLDGLINITDDKINTNPNNTTTNNTNANNTNPNNNKQINNPNINI